MLEDFQNSIKTNIIVFKISSPTAVENHMLLSPCVRKSITNALTVRVLGRILVKRIRFIF